MSIKEIVVATLSRWVIVNPGATDADIDAFVTSSPFPLPADYLELLRVVNGGEAFTAATANWNCSYLVLWPTKVVLQFSAEYGLNEFAPSYFAFATNGAGELFVLDKRRTDDAVFILPAIGMADDGAAMLFADSFNRFVQVIGVSRDITN